MMKLEGDMPYTDLDNGKEESQIRKFFSGTTVLVTGGTGFLGKLMVEKLLRSCPEIKMIYILLRSKKNENVTKRLQSQFEDVLYDKLRKEQPNFVEKIRGIEGDVGELQLGIEKDDIKTLINEVEVIFHGAATVRFDEHIKTAVEINVRGTRELLLLAKQCKKLCALVHISTAFSNCPEKNIKEQFYRSPLSGEKLIEMVDALDDGRLSKITPGLLGEYPNTYVFTKSVAEEIVQKYSKGLPVALVRPSIIIGTSKEPVAGWIDNIYGPTGVVIGASKGILHSMRCTPQAVADLVPGDMVVCMCVAAATKTAKEFSLNRADPAADHETPVYNYISSKQNPITWKAFMKLTEKNALHKPSVETMWYYMLLLTPSYSLYWIYCFFLHWIPAYLVDGFLLLSGKKPKLAKIYSKIDKFSKVISYFALREWKFSNDNTQNLFNELCDADKQIFNFNIGNLDWDNYFKSFFTGIRVYLLKDPVETIPKSLAKYKKLMYAHYFFITMFAIIFVKILWNFVNVLV